MILLLDELLETQYCGEGLLKLIIYYMDAESLGNLALTNKKWYEFVRQRKFESFKSFTWFDSVFISKLYDNFKKKYQFDTNTLYVEPQVEFQGEVANARDVIQPFLKNEKQRSLLILGESGSGKSTLMQEIAKICWYNIKSANLVPIYIYLPEVYEEIKQIGLLDAICSFLRRRIFAELEWDTLFSFPILLLIDGYDEIPWINHLYIKSNLAQYDVKVVTASRLRVLYDRIGKFAYREHFELGNDSSNQESPLSEITLKPFNFKRINDYINKYNYMSRKNKNINELSEYQNMINEVPQLTKLISNPFILSKIIPELPELIKKYRNNPEKKIFLTRVKLYDTFVKAHFKREKNRIAKREEIKELKGSLKRYLKVYSENLAREVSKSSQPLMVIDAETALREELFEPKDKSKIPQYEKYDKEQLKRKEVRELISSGCFLESYENSFVFIHKSIVEYFSAQEVFRGAPLSLEVYVKNLKNNKELPSYSFNERLLTDSFEELSFLVDRARTDEEFKTLLYDVIMLSKKHRIISVAAANAITVLNLAGKSFTRKDFSEISVPYADLSGAICDETNFKNAILRGVNFQHAWLRKADFTGADMEKVNFSELPFIENECAITTMAMDSENRWLMTGDSSGCLVKWDIVLNEEYWVLPIFDFKTSFELGYEGGHQRDLHYMQYGIDMSTRSLLGLCVNNNSTLMAVANMLSGIYLFDIKDIEPKFLRKLKFSSKNFSIIKKMQFFRQKNISYLIALVEEFSSNSSLSYVIYFDLSNEKKDAYQYLDKSFVKTFDVNPMNSILAYSSNNILKIIGLNADNRVCYELNSEALCLRFNPDGRSLGVLLNNNNMNFELYDTNNFHLIKSLSLHKRNISNFKFDSTGKLVIFSSDYKLNIVEISSGNLLHSISALDSINTRWKQFQDDYFVLNNRSSTEDNNPKYDFIYQTNEKYLYRWKITPIQSPIKHPYSRELLELVNKGKSQEFNLDQGDAQIFGFFKYTLDKRYSFSKNLSVRLKLNDFKNCLIIERPETCKIEFGFGKKNLEPYGKRVALTLSPKSHFIAFFYVDTMRLLLSADESIATAGKIINGLLSDSRIWVWDLRENKFLYNLKHYNYIFFMFFSEDEKWMITGGYTLRIWDSKTGACLYRYDQHEEGTASAALTRCKRYLAIADAKGSLGIWGTTTHKRLCHIDKFHTVLTQLDFSKDGDFLLGKDEAGNEYLFRFNGKKLDLYLENRSAQNILFAKEAIIKDARELSESNQILLKQKGALGVSLLPKKETLFQFFNSPKNEPIEPIWGVLDQSKRISAKDWIISIVRDRESTIPEHAFLLLEGIDSNSNVIMQRFDFFQNKKDKAYGFVSIGDKITCRHDQAKNTFEQDILREFESNKIENLSFQSWNIDIEEVNFLVQNIRISKEKKTDYFFTGVGLGFNCFSWAINQIHELNNPNITIKKTNWKQYVFAKTSDYLDNKAQ